MIATDVVPEALDLAAANAERYGVADRIEFVRGDGLAPLAGRTLDALCANLPYIADDEHDEMDEAVRRHVPASAWAGGPDGMDVIAPVIAGAADHLRSGGVLALEIGHRQRDRALQCAAANPALRDAEVLKDQDDLWRVLVAVRV